MKAKFFISAVLIILAAPAHGQNQQSALLLIKVKLIAILSMVPVPTQK